MPIDRQLQQALDQLDRLGAKPINTLTPQEARQQPTLADAAKTLLPSERQRGAGESVNSTDQTIPGPTGDLPIRIYHPKGSGPFPVLVYFHSGGWVLGSLDEADTSCRALASMAQCLVVSVGYRQAPEHKFPAALDDAYAATQWVIENAASIDGDPQRVAVGGESAGANLATVVCLRARTQGEQMPIYQVLIYPVTNFAFDTLSYEQNADAKPLNREMMRWFWRHYLPDEASGEHPYASPLRSADLTGLPPTVIITAEFDPLRDEGEAYAQRLRAAGVPVVTSRYTGMTHLFFGLLDLLEPANKALTEVAAGLRSAFSRSPELAQSTIMPLGAIVAAEAQTKEGVQVGSLGLEQQTTITHSTAQMAGSELVRQTELNVRMRDAARQENMRQEVPQMTSPTQPPEDTRAPGTPIRPANMAADEYDAGHPGTAASEGAPVIPPDRDIHEDAPVIPPDTRAQESAPVIPTDLDEDRGIAAALPQGTAPSESTQVVPGGKPAQERAPVIPDDEGLPATESVIPADRPVEASAPVIPTDEQLQPMAPAPGDFPTLGTPQVPGDIPVEPTASATPVRVGQPVVDANGNLIGQVKAVQAEHFVIDRQQLPDLTVPFYAIRATGDQIMLNLPVSQAESADWTQQPNP